MDKQNSINPPSTTTTMTTTATTATIPQRGLKGKSKLSERYLQAIRRTSSCEVSLLSSPPVELPSTTEQEQQENLHQQGEGQGQNGITQSIHENGKEKSEVPTSSSTAPGISELIAKFSVSSKFDVTALHRNLPQFPTKSDNITRASSLPISINTTSRSDLFDGRARNHQTNEFETITHEKMDSHHTEIDQQLSSNENITPLLLNESNDVKEASIISENSANSTDRIHCINSSEETQPISVQKLISKIESTTIDSVEKNTKKEDEDQSQVVEHVLPIESDQGEQHGTNGVDTILPLIPDQNICSPEMTYSPTKEQSPVEAAPIDHKVEEHKESLVTDEGDSSSRSHEIPKSDEVGGELEANFEDEPDHDHDVDDDDDMSVSSSQSKFFRHTKSLGERTHGNRLTAAVSVFGRKKSSDFTEPAVSPPQKRTFTTPPRSSSSISDYSPPTPPRRDENGMLIPSENLAKYMSLHRQQETTPPHTSRSHSLPLDLDPDPSSPSSSSSPSLAEISPISSASAALAREEMILKREPFKSFRKLIHGTSTEDHEQPLVEKFGE